MINQLLKRKEYLCAQIEECKRAVSAAPPGKLEICSDRASTRWYVKPDNESRRYLPKKEIETARLLAEKRIASFRLEKLKKELRATELYLKHAPGESISPNIAKEQARYAELLVKNDNVPWHLQPFNQNPFFPEKRIHPSPSGHLLRSKAECQIDTELFYRNIPFRYEDELYIGGEIIYPDFVFYNEATGEYKYWEHFGRMAEPGYRAKTVRKTELYFNNGFIPGKNIYFTYETLDFPLTMTTICNIADQIEAWLYQ